MKLIKFILAVSAICFAVMAILLMWSENVVTCSITTCKIFETIFMCCAIGLTKDVAKMKVWHKFVVWLLEEQEKQYWWVIL